MEYLGINSKETDILDKTRVWVNVGNDELLMFKFDHNPTEEEVIEVTNKYIEQINKLKEDVTTEE